MAIATMTQTALIGGPNGSIVLSNSAPLPQEPLLDDQIAIAVKAVSLNPADTKMTGDFHIPGAVLGCDVAGVVTAAGPTAAEEWGYRVGDRVTATVVGMNALRPSIGGFAEHTVSWACAAQRIPDGWSFAQAAGGLGGVGWFTVPWALFHAMGLPAGPLLEPLNSQLPPPPRQPKLSIVTAHSGDGTKPTTAVLVSGGASYTGTCAIQLLKLAGFTVIATCSARNFDLARSFGADAVFDYASPTAAADIRAYTGNSLRLAIDCITTPDSTRLCYAAMGRAGGRYVALEPYNATVAATRAVVQPSWVFGLETLGEDIPWPAPYGRKANPVARDFLKVWTATMQGLVERGVIRLHPQLVRDTGLAGVLEGVDEIRQKAVSGQKLIYTL
ncbi:zinc-binding dehydrogenase family oxidoreductase [Achaetomium macrosporum]|uniref:Zinc-binding dehydrogenase family oxidoreductase n=1 Tax=Achaetomium macrosporum TaxID=79813 RepID=A0AAN7H994_9PEZI|nr:zinc-binding dehydrogenase family oxidoreductase [Achaetomium macrosporum]